MNTDFDWITAGCIGGAALLAVALVVLVARDRLTRRSRKVRK